LRDDWPLLVVLATLSWLLVFGFWSAERRPILSAVAVASHQTIVGLLVCKIHYAFAGRRGAAGVFMMATFWGMKLRANTGPIHWLVGAALFVGFMAICSILYGKWLGRRSTPGARPAQVAVNTPPGP
jgi:hypothetical protein